MNEKIQIYLNEIKDFWNKRSLGQKSMIIGSVALFCIVLFVVSMMSSKVNYEPLYSNLSARETGEIKAQLDSRGINSLITDNGSTISVPEEAVNSLKVELAAEGYPNSGSIDYSFFSQNAGFGMTDNEFNVLKLEAMQTELANLMKGIDGVQDAKVMINLPQESIWISDDQKQASASIVLNTKPGYRFEPQQIKALYNLVSKSVPNLPTDNIVMMNQFFEYFDLKNENNFNNPAIAFQTQHQIKKEIERDIQRQVQQMLGMMMGHNKVVVSVTADIDFTQENREESLVSPVDRENIEGIAVSVERITETFTGNGAEAAGGINEPNDITSYATGESGSNGDYERIEERINNDFNRIRKEIVESPYKVRDIGIQVMVEPPTADDPTSLPEQAVNEIEQILSTIIRTSISKEVGQAQLTDEEIASKVVVSVQPFNGKLDLNAPINTKIPQWTYMVGGGLLLVIILLLVLLLRKRKKDDEEKAEQVMYQESMAVTSNVPDINEERGQEGDVIKSQLERMAKEKPGDFAKLLGSWIAED
jgi:flagellar M-ring protein FliF